MDSDQTSEIASNDTGPRPKLHNWMIEEREYDRQEQRRGRRHAYGSVDARRTALIVIDMVPFFVEESGYCRGILPNIIRLADALRTAGGTVAWIVPGPDQSHPDLTREFFGEEVAEVFRTSGGAGPISARVWAGLSPEAEDLYFEKFAYSAFFPGSSDLPAALRARGIDTVFITGTLTNICCESSARDAYASGFRVIFIADGTAARRDQDHNAALHNIYRSFGDVRPTKEVVSLLSA
ncbi:cysteine hydrolase (plasmid) [Rhizobium leguminosarum]|uniref:isochorismatase family cysteine hydrolase n=1 Tax=Rhizobium ruizarguesonis TaxID=2081791 RepID=UPI0013DF9262|nr:isochorismatase family cysteine hydrolase [Rhizobium ruizarguesonis]NEJ26996.1 isochorismatase family protein [Rhizobium ruizarguesonis]UIK01546.1 cysteine hydrolase [Rhizobium leguminosarum]UIK14441.1 cysteine hydrolase [Rhizobium leguminosarum]UIL31361.1 cysteine hydrolase [Rhizobium leguminosarum]